MSFIFAGTLSERTVDIRSIMQIKRSLPSLHLCLGSLIKTLHTQHQLRCQNVQLFGVDGQDWGAVAASPTAARDGLFPAPEFVNECYLHLYKFIASEYTASSNALNSTKGCLGTTDLTSVRDFPWRFHLTTSPVNRFRLEP